MGTTVEHTWQCETNVAKRINQGKIYFWKKGNLLRINIRMKTRIRILICCVFSLVTYGCETWTFSKAVYHSWTSYTTNDVLQSTDNWCTGNNHDKQPEQQKVVWCGPHNANNSRTTGWKTRKRDTKTNMGRRSKRLVWFETIRPDK